MPSINEVLHEELRVCGRSQVVDSDSGAGYSQDRASYQLGIVDHGVVTDAGQGDP